MKALLVALLVAGLSGRALAADDGNQGGEEPNKQGQAADNRHHQKEEKKPPQDRVEHEKTAARETPNKGGQGSPQQRAEKINTVLKEQNVPPAASKIIQQAMTAGYAPTSLVGANACAENPVLEKNCCPRHRRRKHRAHEPGRQQDIANTGSLETAERAV